jgi:MFS family permease
MTISPAATPADDRFAAFRHKAYARYFVARFLSYFALQIVIVAVGWQIYDLTRDPFDLGLVGLIQFAPALLLMLVTGSVADRFSRRGIILGCDIVEAGCVLALALMTWHGLFSPLPIFAVLLVMGIARAFLGPASQALAPNLVPAKDLPNAVAWNSSAWQTAGVVGPVVGGLLYGLGPLVPYGTGVVLLLTAATAIFLVPAQPRRLTREKQNWDSLMAGFRYIRRERVVLGAISLDMFAVLLGGAIALMPVYARDILELGPIGLGLLRASPGVGAVLMALYLASRPIRTGAGIKMFVGVGLFGLTTIVFGLSTNLPLSLVALACLGAADTISVYVRQSLIQLWTPDELLGRVSAVNMVFIGASNELGEFRAGTMAAFIGAVPAVTLGGVAAIGIAGLWTWLFPELRRIETLDRERKTLDEA